MRRRDTDDTRWAAAASIARGRESPDARRFRRRAQWFTGSLTVLALAALALVVALTPLRDQIFPARGAGRTPAAWQIPLGIAGFVFSGLAFLRWRALNRDANAGNRLPVVDPRLVLRSDQRREADRWIRSGTPPSAERASVVFDRALRFSRFPPPVWQLYQLPISFGALTVGYRGPEVYLAALWAGWAAVTLAVWWSGKRFLAAADRYIATCGMVAEPVTGPSPDR